MAGKRPPIPDDTVFFSLYPVLQQADHGDGENEEAATEKKLLRLRTECLDVVLPLVKDYIWQHQPFDLSVSDGTRRCPCNIPPHLDDETDGASKLPAPASCPHLHGKLKYGDNIEDEWFVVYLLFAISRSLPNLAIRVWDTDGEFLLIEAAYSIPRWLKPENSWNRVFIWQGQIHILPLPSTPAEVYQLPVVPSINDAIRIFQSGTLRTVASDAVQQAILQKLQTYGSNSKNNMHNAVCRVPLPIAQILKHEPQLVALAVAAFYDRDLDSMKAASQMRQFLPEGDPVEMVDVVVRMSRAMYAQLMQQVFQAPRRYPMPPFSDPHYKEAELGLKLTCGFEMMYWDCVATDSQIHDGTPVVQNKDVAWQAFQASLQQSGYFKGLLEGSKEYVELLNQAMEHYKKTDLFPRSSTAMNAPVQRIKEILALPHSVNDLVASQDLKSDDDSWLYSGEDELKNALLERQKEMDAYESEKALRKKALAKNGDVSSHSENEAFRPENVARSMHSFINKVSSFEGAELPSNINEIKGDDDSVSIRMGRFFKELNSAFGSVARSSAMGTFEAQDKGLNLEEMDTSSSDMDFDYSENDESDEDQVNSLAKDFSTKGHNRKNKVFMEEYSEALSKELGSSSLTKSFVQTEKPDTGQPKVDNEELPPVNIDVNLLQSLLDSYSSQQGLPGPASNLLGAMGLHLPESKGERPH